MPDRHTVSVSNGLIHSASETTGIAPTTFFINKLQVYQIRKETFTWHYLPDDDFLSLPKSFMRSFLLYLEAKQMLLFLKRYKSYCLQN